MAGSHHLLKCWTDAVHLFRWRSIGNFPKASFTELSHSVLSSCMFPFLFHLPPHPLSITPSSQRGDAVMTTKVLPECLLGKLTFPEVPPPFYPSPTLTCIHIHMFLSVLVGTFINTMCRLTPNPGYNLHNKMHDPIAYINRRVLKRKWNSNP